MKKFFLKYKIFICFVACMVLISSLYATIVVYRVSKFNGITIVLDAGHGGRDGGSVGVGGTIEKDLNLKYVLALKDKLVENGYKVILTRNGDEGLYSAFAKNKKQSDMKARLKTILEANPNLVVSVHMNSFPNKEVKGAMSYYRKGDGASKNCADLIQKSIQKTCQTRFKESKVGDYYMLNSSYYTAVLIECGFISNPEEEKLLNSDEYMKTFVNAVYNGILLYFGNNQI